MGRGDTYGKDRSKEKKSPFMNTLEQDITTSDNDFSLASGANNPTKENDRVKPEEVGIPQVNIFGSAETERKTYVIDKTIADTFDRLTIDLATGKKKKGAKGIISKIVNNALYKELIELGALPEEYKSNIKDY